ncbi:MAG: CubicO group peptidase (beta-lactamase class C family), partial [Pseudohongiellaceae bacterium]
MNLVTHRPGTALPSWTTWAATLLLSGSLFTGCASAEPQAALAPSGEAQQGDDHSSANAEAMAPAAEQALEEAAVSATPSLTAQERLTAVIPGLLEEHIVPGLTVCLIEQGKISWTGAFGVRRVSDNAPMTDDTVFEAAGLILPIMAQLALELAAEQALDLDQPLGELLPDLPQDARKSRGVTMAMLLSQSAELTGANPDDMPFLHSPEALRLAQRALEQAGGAPLSELLSQRIFEPLAMDSTAMVWREDYNDSSAAGHGLPSRLPLTVRRKARPSVADAPTSLHTTAGDMARFTLAALSS